MCQIRGNESKTTGTRIVIPAKRSASRNPVRTGGKDLYSPLRISGVRLSIHHVRHLYSSVAAQFTQSSPHRERFHEFSPATVRIVQIELPPLVPADPRCLDIRWIPTQRPLA